MKIKVLKINYARGESDDGKVSHTAEVVTRPYTAEEIAQDATDEKKSSGVSSGILREVIGAAVAELARQSGEANGQFEIDAEALEFAVFSYKRHVEDKQGVAGAAPNAV
jgi:hypothetical protein